MVTIPLEPTAWRDLLTPDLQADWLLWQYHDRQVQTEAAAELGIPYTPVDEPWEWTLFLTDIQHGALSMALWQYLRQKQGRGPGEAPRCGKCGLRLMPCVGSLAALFLEHVPDPDQTAAEGKRALREGHASYWAARDRAQLNVRPVVRRGFGRMRYACRNAPRLRPSD